MAKYAPTSIARVNDLKKDCNLNGLEIEVAGVAFAVSLEFFPEECSFY